MEQDNPGRGGTPEISVVIPLYNEEHGIQRAIRSALNQDVNVEVVVVDDGSTDDSVKVVESFGDRVRLARQENSGPGVARNHAARIARSPVLAFLDSDDELVPGCLDAHLRCRRRRPGVKVTVAPFRVLIAGDEVLTEKIVDRSAAFETDGEFHYTTEFQAAMVRGFVGSSVCCDKDLFDAVGGFDLNLHCWEIADLLYRMLSRSGAAGVLNGVNVLVHGCYGEGQFARTSRELKYHVLLAHSTLNHIDALPPDQRRLMLTGVMGCLRELLSRGRLEEFSKLANRVDPAWCRPNDARYLRRVRGVPGPLLRTLSWADGLKQLLMRSGTSYSPE